MFIRSYFLKTTKEYYKGVGRKKERQKTDYGIGLHGKEKKGVGSETDLETEKGIGDQLT